MMEYKLKDEANPILPKLLLAMVFVTPKETNMSSIYITVHEM